MKILRIDKYRLIIQREASMRVDGMVFATERLLKDIGEEPISQIVNVAELPGIVGYSYAMPDIHWGYGFPIGGVAGMDVDKGGVICPGGVGFDINCGVRLVKTNLRLDDISKYVERLLENLFAMVPAGVGEGGRWQISKKKMRQVLAEGGWWAVRSGYGVEEDLEFCEEGGMLSDADPDCVLDKAYKRGGNQLGTLGSGNHFLEVQVVDEIFSKDIAEVFGLFKGQVVVLIHSGSRGLGHQVCSDYLREINRAMRKYGIEVSDRQLACVPFYSDEGQRYWKAMCCAANYAWANRQMLTHLLRGVFERVFGMGWQKLGMYLLYDVSHNIAKIERHKVGGKYRTLCVHRKGATRAFGPGSSELPRRYRDVGQPVIIPGDMGRCSYALCGTEKAMEESLGSSCHGAGRVKSRHKAVKELEYSKVMEWMDEKGVYVFSRGRRTILEEAPMVYKDVDEVVDVVNGAGISVKVARMIPVGVIKG